MKSHFSQVIIIAKMQKLNQKLISSTSTNSSKLIGQTFHSNKEIINNHQLIISW